MFVASFCVSSPLVYLFGCEHYLGPPLYALGWSLHVILVMGFLSGRRYMDLTAFLSEDDITILITTVDTFIEHAVRLGVAVVIDLLVAFGRTWA